jgi:hypothetical protein
MGTGIFSLENTLSGLDANTLQQAVMDRMFQQREQQINAMPPPAQMPVPNKPGALAAILPLIGAAFGDALTQRPGAVEGVVNTFGQRMAAPGIAEQQNREAMSKFDYQREQSLLDLRIKQLDFQIKKAEKSQDQEGAQRLQAQRDAAENARLESEHAARMAQIQFQETEATKRKLIPSTSISFSHSDKAAGGEGGSKSNYEPLIKAEERINEKFPSKIVPGKVESRATPGLFGTGIGSKTEKIQKPSEVISDPKQAQALISLYTTHVMSGTQDAPVAARKLGVLLKREGNMTTAVELMNALVALGIDKENAIFIAKSSGLPLPKPEAGTPSYMPSRKGGKK